MIVVLHEARTKRGKKLEKKFEIPDRLQELIRKKSVREKMPKRCFLDPDNLKYPICNPITKKLDCRFVKAAIARAAGFTKGGKKNPTILRKAEEIYHKKCSAKKESVTPNILAGAILEQLILEAHVRGIDWDQYVLDEIGYKKFVKLISLSE